MAKRKKDRFKSFNCTTGHETGTEALRKTAEQRVRFHGKMAFWKEKNRRVKAEHLREAECTIALHRREAAWWAEYLENL